MFVRGKSNPRAQLYDGIGRNRLERNEKGGNVAGSNRESSLGSIVGAMQRQSNDAQELSRSNWFLSLSLSLSLSLFLSVWQREWTNRRLQDAGLSQLWMSGERCRANGQSQAHLARLFR